MLGVAALVVIALVGSGLTTRPASALQTALCNLFSSGCTTDAAAAGQLGVGQPGGPVGGQARGRRR